MIIEIATKTQREFREKLYSHFATPSNKHLIKFRISNKKRFGLELDRHIYRIDLTAIGKDRENWIGIMAYDEETKEYFFIDMR